MLDVGGDDMKKIYWISALAMLLIMAAGIGYFIYRDHSARIPKDIRLETSDGEVYDFGKSEKKIKLLEFIYTNCPDVCPITTQRMVHLKKQLEERNLYGKRIQFITITIDPYRDTPDVMKKYAEAFGVADDENWFFLTGDRKEIQKIADTFQFQYRDPGNGFYIHSTFFYVLDERNRYLKKFPMGERFDTREVLEYLEKVSS